MTPLHETLTEAEAIPSTELSSIGRPTPGELGVIHRKSTPGVIFRG